MLHVQELIADTDRLLAHLPEDKVRSVHDFVVFLTHQHTTAFTEELIPRETEEELRADMTAIMNHNPSFDFLNDEPDLYSEVDLIEVYK